jgi:hypothetical protein
LLRILLGLFGVDIFVDVSGRFSRRCFFEIFLRMFLGNFPTGVSWEFSCGRFSWGFVLGVLLWILHEGFSRIMFLQVIFHENWQVISHYFLFARNNYPWRFLQGKGFCQKIRRKSFNYEFLDKIVGKNYMK